MRIVALIAAFNEADVIRQTIDDLVAQEIEVYLLDNNSSDDTARIAGERLGGGVLAVEQFPADGGASGEFPWAELLARKQTLAREIEADWYLHQDADELRESPWLHRNLRQGIELVDALGFNAVDFEVLNFRPVDESFAPGADLRAAFARFERAETWDRVQVKAWKRQPEIDLISTGGHESVFPGRRVFPMRFLLRHYPIRSQAHGDRKVFAERRPRFRTAELERGWHRQYEELARTARFVWPAAELERFDPERVRLDLALHNREWEAATGTPAAKEAELLDTVRRSEALARDLDRQNREVERLGPELDRTYQKNTEVQLELDRRNQELLAIEADRGRERRESARLAGELDERNREVARLGAELDRQNREVERLGTELDRQNREVERLGVALDSRNREAERLGTELDRQNREVERLGVALDGQNREAERLGTELDRQNREVARFERELSEARTEAADRFEAFGRERDLWVDETERVRVACELAVAERDGVADELGRVVASRTWRWSAPLRSLIWRLAHRRGAP